MLRSAKREKKEDDDEMALMLTHLEVFHQHSDYYIDQHKLRHQYENNKKQRSNDSVHAAVLHAVVGGITILSKRVLRELEGFGEGMWGGGGGEGGR